ncbi:MAG TPA: hypothetical protein VFG23_09460 [Polyangia bacterium]|nr:hypothetical protein [Polyangia bacterium]
MAIRLSLKSYQRVLDINERAKFARPFAVGKLARRVFRNASGVSVDHDLLVASVQPRVFAGQESDCPIRLNKGSHRDRPLNASRPKSFWL